MFIKYPFCVPYRYGAEASDCRQHWMSAYHVLVVFSVCLPEPRFFSSASEAGGKGERIREEDVQGRAWTSSPGQPVQLCFYLIGRWQRGWPLKWVLLPNLACNSYTNHSLAQHTCQILCKRESREEGTCADWLEFSPNLSRQTTLQGRMQTTVKNQFLSFLNWVW